MQGWPLARKIQETQAKIREWYEHYGGRVFVSFSGGKDSTILLDLVRGLYPDVPAAYADTGLSLKAMPVIPSTTTSGAELLSVP